MTNPTIDNMLTKGGRFVKQLAHTWLAADPQNQSKLRAAFPEIFNRYTPEVEQATKPETDKADKAELKALAAKQAERIYELESQIIELNERLIERTNAFLEKNAELTQEVMQLRKLLQWSVKGPAPAVSAGDVDASLLKSEGGAL